MNTQYIEGLEADVKPNRQAEFVKMLEGNRYLWMSYEQTGIVYYVTNTLGDILWKGSLIELPLRFQ